MLLQSGWLTVVAALHLLPLVAVVQAQSNPACTAAGNSCLDCLQAGEECAWTIGTCQDDCNVADAPCYNTDNFLGETPEAICEIEETKRADRALCGVQSDCGDCTATALTDGTTTCQWFEDAQYCGSGCDMDGCGVTECWTGGGACNNASTCTDCLALPEECAWTIGMCMDDCNVADAPCYNTDNFLGETPEAICEIEETKRADRALCGVQSDCGDCTATATTLTDGTTTCQWFEDAQYCGSGCDMDGCGVTECSTGGGACNNASTCTDCLALPEECAWTIGMCMDDCNVADAPCYNTDNFLTRSYLRN